MQICPNKSAIMGVFLEVLRHYVENIFFKPSTTLILLNENMHYYYTVSCLISNAVFIFQKVLKSWNAYQAF